MLGSVLNQVLLHQSVIGLEAKTALKKYGEYADILIGCHFSPLAALDYVK